MKQKNAPKYKKVLKETASSLLILKKLKNYLKNPLGEALNLSLDRASKMNTKRKNVGQVRNRKQFYNPRIKRYVKMNTKTGKIVGVRSIKGVRYKNIRI